MQEDLFVNTFFFTAGRLVYTHSTPLNSKVGFQCTASRKRGTFARDDRKRFYQPGGIAAPKWKLFKVIARRWGFRSLMCCLVVAGVLQSYPAKPEIEPFLTLGFAVILDFDGHQCEESSRALPLQSVEPKSWSL